MILGEWFRPPRRLLALFVAVIALPAIALACLAHLRAGQAPRTSVPPGAPGGSGRQQRLGTRSPPRLDIWSAVFGPLGPDGFFEPLIDPRTGVIDKRVAAYWRENYDLLPYMQKNWATLGPEIIDKIHIDTGDMDTYQLDKGVVLMEQWMKTTANPHYEGFFLYGDGKPHCWAGPETQAERLRQMAVHIMAHKPAGAATPWWEY